ncbi:MAG: IPT/TIG domain-containing protein [Pseudonocardiales bacterium]
MLSALLAVVLFGIGALGVDLGNMQARKRITQSAADLAALAGAQGLPDVAEARAKALDYLVKNPVAGQTYATCPACYSDNDGPDYANGEIIVTDSTGNTVTTGTTGQRIWVIVPRRTVNFGLAGIMGFSSSTVHAAAEATVGSPAKGKILPFGVTGGTGGLYCIHDNTNGKNAAMRSALLANEPISLSPSNGPAAGGTVVTVTGTGTAFVGSGGGQSMVLVNGAPVTTTFVDATHVRFTSPAQTGPATFSVQVQTGNGINRQFTATATFTYNAVAAPTVTNVSPNSGKPGDSVTITGTGFSPGTVTVSFGGNAATGVSVTSSTSLTAIAPTGAGTVDVIVTVNGTPSAITAADQFTYLVDPCASATGNFGYLDLKGYPNPAALEQNVILGAKYVPGIFPKPFPPTNTQCLVGSTPIAGAIIDDGSDNRFNCADVENGNKLSSATQALLDGINNPKLPPRLKNPPIPPCSMGTVKARTNIENNSLQDFLTIPLQQFENNINGTPTAGVVKKEIYDCPQFFLVPTLDIDGNQANGFYPITGFMGSFVESFETNNNGTQVTAIKAYVFSLDWIANPGGATIPFVGSGPRIGILVHVTCPPGAWLSTCTLKDRPY